MPLRSDILKIASTLPKGDETRRKLLASLQREGALPKVPGISPSFLFQMVTKAKHAIVESLTDSYGSYGDLGSQWFAEWKATEIGSQDPYVHGTYFTVKKASLVRASNDGSFPITDHWDKITPRHRKSADLDLAAQAVAQALKGSWPASAWFGWTEEFGSVQKVGDLFESTGEARVFERMTVEGAASVAGVHAAEYPIRVTVKRVTIRKDGTFRVTAGFKA